MDQKQSPTKLEYYDDMWKLESKSNVLFYSQVEDGRRAMILESTIFHPQGGGQPSDTGFITISDSSIKFVVQDVRSRDGTIFHYGYFEDSEDNDYASYVEKGKEVHLLVNEHRRHLNSKLHSAGHLLDVCMRNVGLGHLEPSKGYHFPDGPFVEYKGTVSPSELQTKEEELELNVNALISRGGKVVASVVPYEEAMELCAGQLPEYIAKGSTPRIVKLGDYPGCPCGGTHVTDISDLKNIKNGIDIVLRAESLLLQFYDVCDRLVSQIRTKKGMTKVFYNIN